VTIVLALRKLSQSEDEFDLLIQDELLINVGLAINRQQPCHLLSMDLVPVREVKHGLLSRE
jgi:hypothetical protein